MQNVNRETILTPSDLYAYSQCSEFWYRGGAEKLPASNTVPKFALESMISSAVRKPIEDPALAINTYVLKAMSAFGLKADILDSDARTIHSLTTIFLYDFLKIFSPQVYFPLTGPVPWRIKVSKTPLDLEVSATFRTSKNNTLHCIYFSPYKTSHGLANDPIAHLTLYTYQNTIQKHFARPQAKLHILSIKETGHIRYASLDSFQISKPYLKQILSLVKTMETNHHFPVLPCLHSCPFKKECLPGD